MYPLIILISFVASACCGFIFIPRIMHYCQQHKIYDIPNHRTIHKNNIPRMGGISFLPSMLLAFFIGMSVMAYTSDHQRATISLWSCMFLISLLLIYFMGIVDDLIGLDAKIKFFGQMLASLLMPLAGLYLNNFYGLFGLMEIPSVVGIPLTILAIVFICNAINLIDGIDGLSSSLCFLSLGGFLWLFASDGLYVYSIMIAGLMGTLVPFAYYNVFGRVEDNRKIFMGDSGSLTLGFILGFLFVKYSMNNPLVAQYRPDALVQSASLLIVPCFDVVRVTIVRRIHHRPLFDADKNHIHHKLLRAGLTGHQTLFTVLALAVFFFLMNIFLNCCFPATLILFVDIIVFCIFHLVLNHFIHLTDRKPFEIIEL